MFKHYNPNINRSHDVEILNHHIAYDGHFKIEKYQLKFRLFDGGWSKPLTREVFERGHAAAVVMVDFLLDKIIFVEQFRIGALQQTANPWLLELVAGIFEKDEKPEQLIIRESKEEANVEVLDLMHVLDYWVSPGGSTEKVSLYCARVDASQSGGIYGLAEEGEDIKVWVLDLQEAYRLLAEGKINNAITLIGLQWLQLNEQRVREKFKSS